MSTYLTRPVFTFEIDWKNKPKTTFEYPLNESILGFALPRYEPLQAFPVLGYEFTIILQGAEEIDAFEAFCDTCEGRINGFWLPSPDKYFEIVDGYDGSGFIIADQQLRNTVNQESCVHVVFSKAGQADQYGKVIAVADDGNGREKVTMLSSLSPAVDETWTARALRYVRFAEQSMDANTRAVRLEQRTVKVVELPNEYTTIETGQHPVYLYKFTMQADTLVTWRYTGLNQNIVSQTETYVSFPIQHGNYSRSLRDGDTSIKLDSICELNHPLSMLYPRKLARPLKLTIYETTYSAPDTRSVIFDGYVTNPTLNGQRISVKCVPLMSFFGRKFPRFLIQSKCNYSLFSAPCGVSKLGYRRGGSIYTTDPAGKNVLQIIVTGTCERNYLAGGYIEVGTGLTWELEAILQNTEKADGKVTIQLARGLRNVIQGGSVLMYPGCDGSRDSCKKYNNFNQWGGHVIAPNNLSIEAIDSLIVQDVNKK